MDKEIEELAEQMFKTLSCFRPPNDLKMHGQMSILFYLYNNKEGVHPLDIAKELGVGPTRISNALNDLLKKKEVIKKKDKIDKRKMIITISQKGIDRIEKVKKFLIKDAIEISNLITKERFKDFLNTFEEILSIRVNKCEERRDIC